MAHAFVANRVVTPQGIRRAALLLEGGPPDASGGLIRAVCEVADLPASADVVDFGDRALLPGLVDTHVHINEPGRTEWEGFATATRAAAAGGYTTLVDMPLNCLPETTTVAALELKRTAANTGGAEGKAQCVIDWAAWGGAVADNQSDLLPLARAGVPGFKCFLIYPGCDGFTMIDREQLERALPAIAQSALPLLVHAELAGPVDASCERLRDADWRKFSTYLASRPDEAELQAIRMMIHLCRKYGVRIHIVHLATAQALPELNAARAEGLPITAEACPHHLHFAAEDIADGATLLKCTPPIRNRSNREALWQGLRNGSIDLIATDHSPCPVEMKRLDEGRFDLAWGGIASLSIALPVVWTDAVRRGFTLNDLAHWMSASPAKLAGFADRVGSLEAGRDANFVVFDPETEFVVTPEILHYRHPISPYMGERLKGVVDATYLRGQPVFQAGKFFSGARGRELTLS
jgi:allantoinase